MFSFCNDKHTAYQEEYRNYFSNLCDNFDLKFNAENCEFNSNIGNLWVFRSQVKSDETFLIIPSLFNSPEILLFNEQQSYIEYLQNFGDVYLLEWKENIDDVGLGHYIDEVVRVLALLRDNFKTKSLHLIGHCIGGNIAIFSNLLYKEVSSLTLLTTPWDYSHFSGALWFSECLNIRKSITGMKMVPKLYIQMMFFMLFPSHFETKLNKYFAIDSAEDREKYLRIEHWLQSGIDIPARLYNEILDEIIFQNSLIKGDYMLSDVRVSLKLINTPTCIISAKNDQIAPLSSMLPLQKEIKNSKLILVEGGHIGYLINDDQQFKDDWRNWFFSLIHKNRGHNGSIYHTCKKDGSRNVFR